MTETYDRSSMTTQPTDPAPDTVDGPPADLIEVAARGDHNAERLLCDGTAFEACRFATEHRVAATAVIAALLEHGWGDVSDLRAQVATPTVERDSWRRVCERLEAEKTAAYTGVAQAREGLRALTEERDRLAQRYVQVMTERDNAVAELAERTRERDDAWAASERWLEVAQSHEMKLGAMRPIVEAAIAVARNGPALAADPTSASVMAAGMRAGADLLEAVERYQQQAVTPEAPIHRYYSTACHHDLHKECQTDAIRWDGTHKIAGTCKWCQAPCGCPCHTAPAAPPSPSEPAPQPHTGARPRATGGIVEPGTWLIGESRDEAGPCTVDAPTIGDGPAVWCRLPHGHAGDHVSNNGARWRVPAPGLDSVPDSPSPSVETGTALEAAIKAADRAGFPGLPRGMTAEEARRRITRAVHAAAPLIEREALERAADRFDALADQDDGYGPHYYAACLLREWAASLVVTGEGE